MKLSCIFGHKWILESEILDGGLYRCSRCNKVISDVPQFRKYNK